MIVRPNTGPLNAVSFETTLFKDLRALCAQEGQEVQRIDPGFFLKQMDPCGCYINLVTLDMDLRRRVSQHLDQQNFERFSVIGDHSVILGNVQPGSFLCPLINMGSESLVEQDVICMGHSCIGHNTRISQGTMISPSVVISGSVHIGQFCYLHTGTIILDKLHLSDNVTVLAGSMIRKNIENSGRYLVNSKGVLKKI